MRVEADDSITSSSPGVSATVSFEEARNGRVIKNITITIACKRRDESTM